MYPKNSWLRFLINLLLPLADIRSTSRTSSDQMNRWARPRLVLERLDERIVFSAIPVAQFPINSATTPMAQQLVVVDPRVPDDLSLVRDIEAQGYTLLVLDPTRDGIAQVTQDLATHPGFTAVHFLSHGNASGLQLGSTWLDQADFGSYAPTFTAWKNDLAPSAELLFYECDLAAASAGRQILSAVHNLTGANVAANTTLTGSASRGGDWNLDYHIGEIHTNVAVSAAERRSYDGVLDVYTVTNTDDSGPGSLRAAIISADGVAGTSTINFSIPTSDSNYNSATGQWTISTTSVLPSFTEPITLDATTQTGYDNSPLVILSGASAGDVSGLDLEAGSAGSVIQGLIINGFSYGYGIYVNSPNDTIQGNWLGLDASGTVATGNAYGIYINSVANTTIGGTTASTRNVISGNNTQGIAVVGSSATGTLIEGNYFGTDSNGSTTAGLGNSAVDINLFIGTTNNTIGGTTAGAENVICGSTYGILLFGSNNTIQGNTIGLDAAGTAALGNTYGVYVANIGGNIIGGTAPAAGNIISGNSGGGIYISGPVSTDNLIEGNDIGTNPSGVVTAGLGNGGVGVNFEAGASSNTIGGTSAAAANIIAGNTSTGVEVNGSNSIDNSFEENSIYANGGSTTYGITLGGGLVNNSGTETSNEPNDDMDSPVFTSALLDGTSLTVTGYVGSAPGQVAFANARVEVFISDLSSDYGSGETYLGDLTTDSSGNFSGILNDVTGVTADSFGLTGTATDMNGNTSEFGANELVTGPATRLVYSIQPGDATAGVADSPSIVVNVEDASGNIVTGDSSNVTLSVASGPGSANGTLTVAARGGVATFSNVILDTAGSYTLTASDGSLSSATSNSFGVSPAAASKLVYTSQPSNVIAGGANSPSIVVAVEDQYGNVVTGDSSNVTLSVASGPGSANGTLTVAARGGVATFSNVILDTSGTCTLRASDGSLTSATSNSVVVSPAAASKVVYMVQPSSVIVGDAVTPSIVVAVEDAYGNIDTGNSSNITLSVASGPGSVSGTLTVASNGGEATFSNVILDTVGTYALTASDGSLTSTISSSFTVSNGLFVVTNTNDSGAGSLRAAITSANAISGFSTITFALPDSDSNYNSSSDTWTISTLSPLPMLTEPITIIGSSQSGYSSTPLIVLDGASAGGGINGINLGVGSGGSLIEGLSIEKFSGTAIDVASSNDTIQSDWLELNGSGVTINNVSGTWIGGAGTGVGNTISDNVHDGVDVTGSDATGNAILRDSFSGNGGLGINLAVTGDPASGVTLNSGTKTNGQPNLGMNFPVFTTCTLTNGNLSVAGYIGTAANSIEFAGSRVELDLSDGSASGYGAGQTDLGFLTADANGDFSGSLPVRGVLPGMSITATATDSANNTSEFSQDTTVYGTTTTSLVSSTESAVYGAAITFTAAVTVNGEGGPATGTITFKNGPTTLGAVALSSGAATFTTHVLNVGTYTNITAVYSGDGSFASSSSPALTQTVTPATLTITATGQNKVYDGGTAAVVTLSSQPVNGDNLTLSYTSAAFASKDVGTQSVTVSGISISGSNAEDYSFNSTIWTSANITPFMLSITAIGNNKVYDGTTLASVILEDNRIAGDHFSDSYISANFSDKNVGDGKRIAVTGIRITGPDAANYSFDSSTLTSADILPRPLTISATGVNKVYDGTTMTAVILSDNRIAGDQFTDVDTTADFSDKNVGVGKSVTVNGITINGPDAGNYSFNAATLTTANITPSLLRITVNNQTKVYGAALPTLTASYMGFVGGDSAASLTTLPTLTTAASATSSVASSPYTITASGAVDPNYTIIYVAGSLSVTPAPLTITAHNLIKVHKAKLPPLTESYSGFVNGDTAASLTTLPTLTTTATAKSPISESGYPITVSGAVDNNYSIRYVPGTLSIVAAPTVSFRMKPAPVIASTTATFQFVGHSSLGISYFEIKRDGGVFAKSSGRVTFKGLTSGRHTLVVEAVDSNGDISAPESYSWTVFTNLPADTNPILGRAT
jgi:hypothetical protein